MRGLGFELDLASHSIWERDSLGRRCLKKSKWLAEQFLLWCSFLLLTLPIRALKHPKSIPIIVIALYVFFLHCVSLKTKRKVNIDFAQMHRRVYLY